MTRYCPRCNAATDHFEFTPPLPRGRWAMFRPLIRLLDRLIIEPMCRPCLERATRRPHLMSVAQQQRPSLTTSA